MTKIKYRKPASKAATMAEAASLEFQPLVRAPDMWEPPSQADWVNPYLCNLRFAWEIMFKTKAELMEFAAKDVGEQLHTQLVATKDELERAVKVLEMAETRLLVAGAAAFTAADKVGS